MILYIAGPMTGITDFNYPAFHAADKQLTTLGFDTLNPANSETENTTGKPQEWTWYMRRALAMVLRSDGLCLLPNWGGSRGAQLEVKVAEELGLDIRPFDEWLKYRGPLAGAD